MATTSQQSRQPRRTTCAPRRKRNLQLISLRINHGLDQKMLAYRTGISRQYMGLIEDGHVPGPGVQFDIAKVFDLLPLDIWPIDQQKAAQQKTARQKAA